MVTVATMRGTTSFFMGSVPRARMASICFSHDHRTQL